MDDKAFMAIIAIVGIVALLGIVSISGPSVGKDAGADVGLPSENLAGDAWYDRFVYGCDIDGMASCGRYCSGGGTDDFDGGTKKQRQMQCTEACEEVFCGRGRGSSEDN